MIDFAVFLGWVRSGYKFRFVPDTGHIDVYVTNQNHIQREVLEGFAKDFDAELDWVGVSEDGLTEAKYKIKD